MNTGVVSSAAELGVVEVGFASVGPVDDVVDVAPRHGHVASGVDTSAISEFECSSQCGGNGAGASADVDGLRLAVGDDAYDACVTGPTFQG